MAARSFAEMPVSMGMRRLLPLKVSLGSGCERSHDLSMRDSVPRSGQVEQQHFGVLPASSATSAASVFSASPAASFSPLT